MLNFFSTQEFIKMNLEYNSNTPFPNIVIDRVFDHFFLSDLKNSFPKENHHSWKNYTQSDQVKFFINSDEHLPEDFRNLLFMFNSSTMINFLEKVTGIKGLIPDPHFDAAGPHLIKNGGHLNLHTDYNFNKKLNLDRRLNAILYLNDDYQEDFNGHLELWDYKNEYGIIKPKSLVKKISPIYGRLVIFNTTDFTFHGHPDPFQGKYRKSIAMYYFTNGRPKGETWVPRGGQHTLFEPRPNSKDERSNKIIKWILRHPFIYKLIRSFKKRDERN